VRRFNPLLAALVAAVLGGLSVLPLHGLSVPQATAAAGLMHMVALVAAMVSMLRAARSGDVDVRRPMTWLTMAMGASAAGLLIGVGYVALRGHVPVPSLADPVTILWVVFAVRALWLVPLHVGAKLARFRLFTDGAIAASALLFISWVLVLQPMAQTGQWSDNGRLVMMIFPLGDVFIAAMVLSLLPRVRADLRAMFGCMTIGLLLIGAADSRYAFVLAQAGVLNFDWADAVLQAGLSAIIVAAWVGSRPAAARKAVESVYANILPFLPVLGATVVGLYYIGAGGTFGLDEGIICAVMLTMVITRTVIFTLDLSRAADENHHAATHDELTGLANRKAFVARLTALDRPRTTVQATVLIADLDGFKEVNDTLGHAVGDQLLQAFAERLTAVAGNSLAARLGGDEFAVLVVSPHGEALGRQMAAQLTADRLPRLGGVGVTCSVGIATLRPGDSAADVLRHADLAMYAAKRTEQTNVALFTDSLAQTVERRNLLSAALAGAHLRGEMQLVYQPLFGLRDGALYGAEALLRWTHPLFGPVPPYEFIALAEETGDIRDIGLWVLDTALAQLAAWERAGRHLPTLFVNTAATQFTRRFPSQVKELLQRHAVPADRLTLEITESQLPNLDTNNHMQQLRVSGVRIALDDFGTGYSSLAQLTQLPVDLLKIDRDFIRNLDSTHGRAVLDAITSLAKALRVATVAEGIEDVGQAAEAANVGIDYAQGYLLGHPVPAHELEHRLTATTPPATHLDPTDHTFQMPSTAH
jgi:diguanylate cyclase